MTLNMKKTFEMVVKGKTTMPLPEPVDGITRKSELKLLGVTVNEDPCNWDVQFENMLSKATSRLYILRVCKYYGFSLQELTLLFDSLIMSFSLTQLRCGLLPTTVNISLILISSVSELYVMVTPANTLP